MKMFANGPTEDKDKLLSMVKFINAHSNDGRHMIAVAAASRVLYAVSSNGDVEPANKLIEAIGPNQRGDTLVKWFLEFGPFKINDNKDGLAFGTGKIKQFQNKMDTPENKRDFAQSLVLNPFWVWQPPKSPFKPAVLEQLLAQAISKVEKQLKSTDISDEDRKQIDSFGIDEAKATLKAIRLKRALAESSTAAIN